MEKRSFNNHMKTRHVGEKAQELADEQTAFMNDDGDN